MQMRRSCSTRFAFTKFALPACILAACAEGSTRPGGTGGQGGDGGTWGQAASSSSAASSGSAGGGGSSGSSASSSSSSGGPNSSIHFLVLRVGTGVSSLTNEATPGFIEHLQTDGMPVPGFDTLALPTAPAGSNLPLTLSGTASTEGNLSLTADEKFVFVGGYSAPIGTPTVNSTDATIYPRVVGRITAQNTVDTSTSLGNAFSGNSIRGATSSDGANVWASGNGSTSTGGIFLGSFGYALGTQIVADPTNTRFVHIFAGQLYGSSGAGAYVNVFTIGNGLPVSAGQTATSLPGMPTTSGPSPYSFALLDRLPNVAGLDTLYVADDRSIASGGGIQRWVSNGTQWSLETNINDGTVGVRGLAATIEGTGVRIVATTSEASMNRILSIFDDGGFSPSIYVIATAPANTVYRGVAFAPK